MRKRSAFALLCLFMMLTLLLTTACSVAPTEGVFVGNTEVTSGGYWCSDGEGGITQTGASESNYTVRYVHHPASGSSGAWGELTLNHAAITKCKDVTLLTGPASSHVGKTALYSTYPLTIHLIGHNTLKGANCESTGGTDSNFSTGVCMPSDNTLTVKGSGSLEATGGTAADESAGMLVTEGVIIKDGATVITTGGAAANCYGVTPYYDIDYCTIESGRLVARAQAGTGTSSALAFAPTNPTSAYYWRIAESDSYTQSTTTPYTYSDSHTYVDICTSLPISIAAAPAAAFLQGAAPETTVTVGAGITGFGLNNFDSVQMGPQGGTLSTLRDGTDYRKANGSIIITLEPAYLNALAPGVYTLQINLKNMPTGNLSFVRTAITVNAPGGDVGIADVPKTGDSATPALWLGLILLAGAGLAGGAILRRRRQNG